jgi:hypothetical protein
MMMKLQALARQHHCAIVALRHLTKSAKDKLAYRGMGSMGTHKGCRSQLVCVPSTEVDGQIIAQHTKHNLSRKGSSIVFQFIDMKGRGVVEWVGTEDVSDEEVNERKASGEGRTQREVCKKWLGDLMASGKPMKASEIYERAETNSFGKKAIYRAAGDLGIRKETRTLAGHGSVSVWTLETPSRSGHVSGHS